MAVWDVALTTWSHPREHDLKKRIKFHRKCWQPHGPPLPTSDNLFSTTGKVWHTTQQRVRSSETQTAALHVFRQCLCDASILRHSTAIIQMKAPCREVSDVHVYRYYLQGEINSPSTGRCLKYSADCSIAKASENLPVSVFKVKLTYCLAHAEAYGAEPVL